MNKSRVSCLGSKVYEVWGLGLLQEQCLSSAAFEPVLIVLGLCEA